MKKFNSFLTGSLMLSASLFLFSCKKQVAEPLADASLDPSMVVSSSGAECKPAFFGVFAEPTGPFTTAGWSTIAQKWYAGGMLHNLKAYVKKAPAAGHHEGNLSLDWGELIYQDNQVLLKDVLRNEIRMRVTLDNQGRPAASYYRNTVNSSNNTYWIDTTYYYYTGNRLDSTITLYEQLLAANPALPHIHLFKKYKFGYDAHGNLITVDGSNTDRWVLKYDYSKPLNGVISNFHLTTATKLMEYMELLKIPMHHAVTEINWGLYDADAPDFLDLITQDKFQDYVISNGLVHSYVMRRSNDKYTFYNGWECGSVTSPTSTNRQKTGITSLEQFQQAYPQSEKR